MTVTACIAAALLLAACSGKRAAPQAEQSQQMALERARGLCRDFGYAPGSMEFARCAQSEYDRMTGGPPPTAPVVSVPVPQVPQAAQPQVQAIPVPQASVQTTRPASAPTPAPQPTAQAQPQPTAQAQPAPQSGGDDDDWLIRYLKRPNVCGQAACSVR